MHFLLLGATGRTGSLLLSQSIHTITALVRDPTKLQPHPNLTIIKGTPLSQANLDTCFTTTPIDAVLITLAVPRSSDNPFTGAPTTAPFFIRDSVRNAITSMKKHGVKRLIVMSVLGAGSSWQESPWLVKAMMKYTKMSYVLEDHDAVDQLVRKSEGIEWTLIRPPMLKDGEVREGREFGEFGRGIGAFDSITRASVAELLIRAATEGRWIGEAVVVAN